MEPGTVLKDQDSGGCLKLKPVLLTCPHFSTVLGTIHTFPSDDNKKSPPIIFIAILSSSNMTSYYLSHDLPSIHARYYFLISNHLYNDSHN